MGPRDLKNEGNIRLNQSRFSILCVDTDHLILLYTDQVFPIRFIQFMVPGPKRFRQSETCSVKTKKIVKRLEIMPWEEWLKELTGLT